jgi:Ran GTPase-activating protein (RanGAP) involved in mRNA processing and transport
MTRLTNIIKDLCAGVDIKKIDLYKRGIGNEEVKLLLQALEKYNNTVTEIDLDSNRITNEGAELIAHFLEENSSVTYIGFEQQQDRQ